MFTIGQFDNAKNATVATLNSKKIKIVEECVKRKDRLAANIEDEADAGLDVEEQGSVSMDEDEVAASDARAAEDAVTATGTGSDLDATETVDVRSAAALRIQLNLAQRGAIVICLLALAIAHLVS
jgi:hypothetical protein